MKPLKTIATILVFTLLGASAATGQAQDNPKSHSLFDGKSLEGWHGDERFWRVENGSIVGQTTKENPTEANTFLIWQGGDVKDFILKFKYRMEGGNSGVQIRSQIVEGFRIKGYQADFDSKNSYTGIFYDEGGRGIIVPRCKSVTIDEAGKRNVTDGPVDEATYLEGINPDGWNEVVITAKGNRLTHSINGNVSAVLVDSQTGEAEAEGVLALQLHQGPPMKIEFKDIELTVQ